jgi:hypothetical protein
MSSPYSVKVDRARPTPKVWLHVPGAINPSGYDYRLDPLEAQQLGEKLIKSAEEAMRAPTFLEQLTAEERRHLDMHVAIVDGAHGTAAGNGMRIKLESAAQAIVEARRG